MKHSEKIWSTRLDQYLNYGEEKLELSSLFFTLTIFFAISFAACVMLSSALAQDTAVLSDLRKTYRERIRKAKRRVRSVRPTNQNSQNNQPYDSVS